MEAVQANIRALQVHEQFIRKQLQLLDIVSPIDGVVTTPKLKEKIGQNVGKGDLISEVYAMKQVMVEISIPEREIGDVHMGQKVVLKARAYPGETFEGSVVAIAPVATKAADDWISDRSVRVTTQLDNTRGLLKPEMTGNCKIFCGEQTLLKLASRRFVRYFRVEFWSWW
jgi:multidrug efflux pump subunit AcrA (membrane-fusion protein)